MLDVDLPDRLNIADRFLCERLREGLGDAEAVRLPGGSHSYADVAREAARFAHALRSLGVEPENRVLLALPDGTAFVAALFGALALGGVVVLLNAEQKPEDLAWHMEHARAKVVVCDAAKTDFVAARALASWKPRLLTVGDAAASPDAVRFSEASRGAPERLETFPTHRDDPAIWLYTGGTTGRPKAAVQTHASFLNTTVLYGQRTLGVRRGDVVLAVPKLFFGYALGCVVLFPFSVGATAALFPEKASVEAVFDMVERLRPTILVNVPTMIARMVAHESAPRRDLASLRLTTSAGEALPATLFERWRALWPRADLLDGLGTAEMWHIFISNRPGNARAGSIGEVVPGFEAKVADAEGRALPPGEPGELWVRGRSMALGYWQARERTAAAFRGEWYVTGDIVARDADGFFTYCGRGDEALKVAGKWVAPQEVEGVLLAHAAVKACAVVGRQDEKGLVKPYAFVEAPGAGPELAAELAALATARLEPHKRPRAVEVVAALPRTHLGKIDRGALRR
jgi:benzoate-CoA ligase family protein